MKRITRKSIFSGAIFSTLFLCFTASTVLAESWVNGYMGANLTDSGETSVGVDLDNNPVVSFFDSNDNALKLYRSADRSIDTVDSGGIVGTYNSLAMHGNNPRIAYLDSTDSSNSTLKYASWNGSAWEIEVVDSGNVGWHASLKLNFRAGGAPVISYYDGANQNLKLASKNLFTGSWHIETVDDTDNVGWFSSLDLDKYYFFPRIAYTKITIVGGSAEYELKYAEKDSGPGSGSWTIQTVDTAGNVGEYASLAMGAAHYDLPGISYYDRTLTNLKYAAWNGTSWDIETVDGAFNPGEFSSLEIDRNGNPMISYAEHYVSSGDETYPYNTVLKFAHKKDGINWIRQRVNSNPGTGHHTDLAIDYYGYPVISHRNTTSTPGASTVAYAWWDPANTAAGNDVVVSSGNVTVTFEQVTASGITDVTQGRTGSLADFQASCNPPVSYDITTTAEYSGNIEVCVTYDDAVCDESNLMLLHNDGDLWVDVTSSLDSTNDVICGVVPHLSGFTLARNKACFTTPWGRVYCLSKYYSRFFYFAAFVTMAMVGWAFWRRRRSHA